MRYGRFRSRRPAGAHLASVSAHRGGAEQARPATYEAYQHSVGTGAEYVEFDIRRTRDGTLVVFHDPAAGTGGGTGAGRQGRAVGEVGYAELCALAGYQVPLVEDVMALLAGRALGHLDLKETGYETEVVALAERILGPGNFLATTMEDCSITAIKRSFPQVRAALAIGRDLAEVPRSRWIGVRASELAPLPRIRSCGADWVAANYKLARLGVLGACHRSGIGAMVWTVDGDALIDAYLTDPRVDVLITNRPEHAVRRRAALAR